MFKKPFTQKSSNLLKKVDRKMLQNRMKSSFFLEDDVVEKILPRKQDVTVTRIQTYQNADINVYSVDKRAMFFDFDQYGIAGKRLIPTVYLLWQYPELVYAFTVYDGILEYVYTGANLMMPGVVKSPAKGPTTYFLDNQIASISTVKNKASVAVGLTAMSGDSSMGGQRGKVLTVLHYYNDYLCYMHDMSLLSRPMRRSIEADARDALQRLQDFPRLDASQLQHIEPEVEEDVVTEVTDAIKALTLDEPGAEESPKTHPVPPNVVIDEALLRCFIIVAKYSPTLQLPQLTSSFYKKEMVQMMDDQQLDIKTSSYKKVGEFLKAMQKQGLCKIGQKQKGVDTVEEINYSHESITAFYLPVERRPKVVEEACSKVTTKTIDTYVVVPEVVDIFLPKYRVGAVIKLYDAKKSTLDYIKKNDLQDMEKDHTLARTPVLQRLSPPGSTRVPNAELMHAVLYAMQEGTFKVPYVPSACTSSQGFYKARLPRPVRMQIQTHHGKTVTVVSNLQDYSNVHLTTLTKEVQVIAAASAKVKRETHQLQVQGNQIDIIATLLNKKYGICKSKMMGLELAPKLNKSAKKN